MELHRTGTPHRSTAPSTALVPTTDLRGLRLYDTTGGGKGVVDLIIGGRTGEAPCPRRWREKRGMGGKGVYIDF